LILNYGKAGRGPVLVPGMTIAIEPMATLGRSGITLDEDDWTIRTEDGSLAAQFEHTLLITEDGPEILTLS
jgi:methionyl aminopeptidase